jgi:hypothetical protein
MSLPEFLFHPLKVRINTRLIYTQQRFNLLREESEGWAKLFTLLNASGAGKLTVEGAAAAVGALAGYLFVGKCNRRRFFFCVIAV